MNQTSSARLACLVADLPRDLADALLDAHRAALVELQGRLDAALALADKATRDLTGALRDRARLWENYVELSQRYHNEREAMEELRRQLAGREIAWRAVRRDLREAAVEDRARVGKGVVGEEGIGLLLVGRKS